MGQMVQAERIRTGGANLPAAEAEDMTAPETLAEISMFFLDTGRRPDMTLLNSGQSDERARDKGVIV